MTSAMLLAIPRGLAVRVVRGEAASRGGRHVRPECAVRRLSMPSRAATRPFALAPLRAQGVDAGAASSSTSDCASWAARSSAGLFTGPHAAALCDQAQRVHVLSPLLPAEAMLRTALQRVSSGGGTNIAAPVAAVVALA